jgi:hypothetical protein
MNMHAKVTMHAHTAKRDLLDAGAGLHARASQSKNKGVNSKSQSKRKGSNSKAHVRRNIRKESQRSKPAPLTIKPDHCRGYPRQPPAIGKCIQIHFMQCMQHFAVNSPRVKMHSRVILLKFNACSLHPQPWHVCSHIRQRQLSQRRNKVSIGFVT